MDLKDFKLYNVCVMRLRHQIDIAQKNGKITGGRALLESYCTGDLEEIIDIHELYDIEDRTLEGVMRKLEGIAKDAALFVKENIEFGFNAEGHLCLYLVDSFAEDAEPARDDKELALA